MRTSVKLATTLGSLSPAQQLAAYLSQIGFDLLLNFDETSGNPVNRGSLVGLAITNSSAAAPTQGQNGLPMGGLARPNEAYDFAGETSAGGLVSVANNATLKAWGNQKWVFVCHPDSLGASSSGKLAVWDGFGAADHLLLGMVSSNRVQTTMNTDTTNGAAVTNTNQISDCIGADCIFFMDYDDADVLGNGRKIRIWKGLAGVVTQLTLATNTAATGTLDQSTNPLSIGNRSNRDQTFDGRIDLLAAKGAAPGADTATKTAALWTATEMQNITNFFV